MGFRILTVIALLFGLNSDFANAVELRPAPTFDADIRIQPGAIGKDGKIDNKKVAIFVRARQKAEAVDVYGTLETYSGGRWQMIGSIVCPVGSLEAGQSIVYIAVSCHVDPNPIVAYPGRKLWASLTVSFTGGKTGTVRTRVRTYPPGLPFN